MLRRVLAVAAGFGAWSAIWAGFHALMLATIPDEFTPDGSTESSAVLLAFLATSVVCSIVAGWVTALVARRSIPLLGWLLGGILLGVGVMVQVIAWVQFPLWYHLIFLVLLVPGVFFGNRLVGEDESIEAMTA